MTLDDTWWPSPQASGADRVVLATGVSPRRLNIPGEDHPSVASYLEVLLMASGGFWWLLVASDGF